MSKHTSEEMGLTQFHAALERADSAIKSVLDGASHELDLLALQASLSEARSACDTACAPAVALQSDLQLLKSDLASRILTMTRAIDVALDKRNTQEESILADEVTGAPAEALLRLYRRACVRFRDTFPGSVRYLSAGATAPKDWSDFTSE